MNKVRGKSTRRHSRSRIDAFRGSLASSSAMSLSRRLVSALAATAGGADGTGRAAAAACACVDKRGQNNNQSHAAGRATKFAERETKTSNSRCTTNSRQSTGKHYIKRPQSYEQIVHTRTCGAGGGLTVDGPCASVGGGGGTGSAEGRFFVGAETNAALRDGTAVGAGGAGGAVGGTSSSAWYGLTRYVVSCAAPSGGAGLSGPKGLSAFRSCALNASLAVLT
jgi:hypothetical protein